MFHCLIPILSTLLVSYYFDVRVWLAGQSRSFIIPLVTTLNRYSGSPLQNRYFIQGSFPLLLALLCPLEFPFYIESFTSLANVREIKVRVLCWTSRVYKRHLSQKLISLFMTLACWILEIRLIFFSGLQVLSMSPQNIKYHQIQCCFISTAD